MKTKLYAEYGKETVLLGEFKSKEKAKEYFKLVQPQLRSKLGIIVSPIYVQTVKGRSK